MIAAKLFASKNEKTRTAIRRAKQWMAFLLAYITTLILPSSVAAQGIFDGIRDPFQEALGDSNAAISGGIDSFFLLITALFALLALITLVGGIFAYNQSRDLGSAFTPFLLVIAFAITTPIVINIFMGAS